MSIKSNLGPLLAVFAKRPVAGQAKTRLAQSTSPEWARAAAQAMLEDSLDRFAEIDLTKPLHPFTARMIVYAPNDAGAYFADLAKGRYELRPQSDEDNLGLRIRNFFEWSRQQDYAKTLVVGTDSPTLPVQYVLDAMGALETHDIVVGPAFDGGFYLLGATGFPLPPLHEISWSTARVLDQLIEHVDNHAKVALLAPWYDIDSADDWAMMRGHVNAMRRAGLDPGVPRIERLMIERPDFV
jgi:rSAM/selenodomain-associated transferase 1